MKIKHIAILYTILMTSMVLVGIKVTNSNVNKKNDTVAIYSQADSITEALNSGETIDTIKSAYNVDIVMHNEDTYKAQIASAIKNNRILLDYEKDGILHGKIIFRGAYENGDIFYASILKKIILFAVILLSAGYLLLFVIYYCYERPFKKLKQFAGDIAGGNLDSPLEVNRHNYFGAFTESFDIMREELKKSKDNEYRANKSKKELVVSLSHDMKTPIATIKATSEVMEVKINRSVEGEVKEDFLKKTHIIYDKADMLEKLINNLFNATLEELETLKVEPTLEASTCIYDMFDEYTVSNVPECLIYMDKLRLKQVISNIINNSLKYAGTDIKISVHEETEGIVIIIRDYGPGVNDDELSLVTEKFYRGSNGKGMEGAGLGLYLANYFMDKMNGSFYCYNDDGFVAELFLKKA